MAATKIETGKIVVTQTKRGWEVRFEKEKGGGLAIFNSKEKPSFDSQAGILTSRDGKALLLELAESKTVVFGTPEKTTSNEVPNGRPPKSGSVDLLEGAPDSFNLLKSQLPKRTKEAMRGFRQIDNFNLKFYKAARLENEGNKLKFQHFKAERSKITFAIKANFGNVDFKAIAARTSKSAASLGYSREANTLASFNAASSWRWIAGLGNASVYENGMTLHHVYGIPYIPGSGIKGMLRSWIIKECFASNENAALGNKVFQEIFGFPNPTGEDGGEKGKAVFFDAFPVREVVVEPDIMNNHYQDYYDEKTPPADWINPNPIFFMTVMGSEIQFVIGMDNGAEVLGEEAMPFMTDRFPKLSPKSSRIALVESWLEDALTHHGIGAKTAAGYGRMTKPAS